MKRGRDLTGRVPCKADQLPFVRPELRRGESGERQRSGVLVTERHVRYSSISVNNAGKMRQAAGCESSGLDQMYRQPCAWGSGSMVSPEQYAN